MSDDPWSKKRGPYCGIGTALIAGGGSAILDQWYTVGCFLAGIGLCFTVMSVLIGLHEIERAIKGK